MPEGPEQYLKFRSNSTSQYIYIYHKRWDRLICAFYDSTSRHMLLSLICIFVGHVHSFFNNEQKRGKKQKQKQKLNPILK